MILKASSFILGLSLLAFTSCQSIGRPDQSKVFTLYRNSVSDPNLRIHVATFDANESEGYNHDNAKLAVALFQQQPGVLSKFWIEKGYFKK